MQNFEASLYACRSEALTRRHWILNLHHSFSTGPVQPFLCICFCISERNRAKQKYESFYAPKLRSCESVPNYTLFDQAVYEGDPERAAERPRGSGALRAVWSSARPR